MSDTPQGPGWWQASDDKWYPPPRPDMPGGDQPPPGAYPSGPPTSPVGLGGPPLGSGPGIPGAAPSPYGGVPPVGAPPGQNRTPLFVALGVLGAAAIVLLIVLLSGGDDDEPEETANNPTTTEQEDDNEPITLPDSPDTTAGDDEPSENPGADAVQVVDSGFSEYYNDLYEANEFAYGVIVENTSDQVATSVSLQVGFLDASGTALGTDQPTIYVLGPGQRMGVGGTGFDVSGVTELSVAVDAGEFEDPADYGTVTAEGINVTFGDYSEVIVNFTAKSTYSQTLDGPWVYAIFRNAEGKIVAGESDFMGFIQENGSSVGTISTYGEFPGLDAAKTEVYVDPSLF